MKAWNDIKNDCDQETGKGYSTLVQIIVKDDRGKAIAWRSISCKMTCCHVQTEKQYKFSVCILYLVCILYPVCSLHFVLTGLILLFLFKQASSPDRNIEARKKILVMLSVGRYDWCVNCILKSSRGKAQLYSNDYFISTEDERKRATYPYCCLRCSSALSQHVLKWTHYGSPRCEHFGPSIQIAF